MTLAPAFQFHGVQFSALTGMLSQGPPHGTSAAKTGEPPSFMQSAASNTAKDWTGNDRSLSEHRPCP